MAITQLYIGLENLALDDAGRDTLLAAIQALGKADGGAAEGRMQPYPIRLDHQAGIFEATLDTTALTVAAWKARLAAVFNVSAASITSVVQTPGFGAGTSTLVTFGRAGTDYIRACVFGGVNATKRQSRDECWAYLAANRDVWGLDRLI